MAINPNGQPYLNLSEWRSLMEGYRTLEIHLLCNNLKSQELSGVIKSFIANADRTAELCNFPHRLHLKGRIEQLIDVSASMHAFGNPNMHQSGFGGSKDFNDAKEGIMNGTIKPYLEVFLFYDSQVVMDTADETTRKSISDLMMLQLVMANTTFETLAGDLWESCLNARHKLGFAALGYDVTQEDETDDIEGKGTVRFSIPVRLLDKYKLNLHDSMGTLLRSKWNFTRRKIAHEAYKKVFGKDSFARLSSIFDAKDVLWLVAVRNAVVHKAGLADDEFVRVVKRHPTLSKVAELSPIPVDGKLCSELVLASFRGCVSLIQFVDEWLAVHT